MWGWREALLVLLTGLLVGVELTWAVVRARAESADIATRAAAAPYSSTSGTLIARSVTRAIDSRRTAPHR